MNFSSLWLLLSIALLAGCGKAPAPTTAAPGSSPPAPAQTIDNRLPKQAQPRLATIKLYVGAEELVTEQALTQEQSNCGMMFRTNMPENEAMIFVFPGPHQAGFWMKNCPYPLSVAYIDPAGRIQEIHDLQPHNTNTVLAARDNIQFAIEVNQGWFQRHNVKPGALVKTEKGSLLETYFQRQ
jgi:uncharacterized protein